MTARRTFVAGAAAGAAALFAPRPARSQTLIPLRVAGIPIDVGASCYYAKDMGFFEKHGLNVQLISFANGPAVASALIGGSLDVGDGDASVLSEGHEKGLPFVMIAPSGMYRASSPTSAFLVAKDSPIMSPKDLIGKTIGLASLASYGAAIVFVWLQKQGIKPSDLKIVEVPFFSMPQMLASGRVDAIQAEEPILSMVKDQTRVLGYPGSAIGSQFIEGGYFVTVDFAKQNQDTIRRFNDAIAETDAWANTHHDESYAILAKNSKSAPPKDMTRIFYPERLRVADLQPVIDATAAAGLIKKSFPARELIAPGVPG